MDLFGAVWIPDPRKLIAITPNLYSEKRTFLDIT
jgi:hypothetical protein